MRFEGLDLNLLVALDALLTERNVSVAADRVHLSQSAMSGTLNRLREYFRDELLVPAGRKMVLTPRGEQLSAPVRDALLQIRSTITVRPGFTPATSDRLFSIIASDYAAVVVLAGGLSRISAEAPNMRFRLANIDGAASDRIDRGEADFLITLEQHISPSHSSAILFEDDYVAVAWAHNNRFSGTLDEDAYFSSGHIGIDLGTRAVAFDAWYLQMGHRSRRVEVTVPSFTLAPHMVINTNRIATMHRRLAEFFAQSLPLKLYPLPFDIPRVRQAIQWHRWNDSDPATLWVRDRLMECLRL